MNCFGKRPEHGIHEDSTSRTQNVQSIGVPWSQVVEEILEVNHLASQERTKERIVQQSVVIKVPHISEEIVEVSRLVPLRRI